MSSTTPIAGSDKPPKPMWGITEVVIGFVVLIVSSSVAAPIWTLISGQEVVSGHPLTLGVVMMGLLSAWVAFLGIPIYIALRWSGGFRQFGLKFCWPRDVFMGILFAVLAQLAIEILYFPLRWVSQKTANSVSSVAHHVTAAAQGWRWIPFIICLAILAPFFEELFFRGVTLKAFTRKWGPIWGIIISGVLFGLAHFEGIQTPALVGFGWLLAWRATRTGRIGETIFTHMAFNALSLLSLVVHY